MLTMRSYQMALFCSLTVLTTLVVFAIIAMRSTVEQPCEFESSGHIVNRSLSTLNFTKRRENIFFLKAHKCGSSTVQNILLRYGRANKLLFLLPSQNQVNYIGNPKPFHGSLIEKSVRTADNTYNVFTHHTRYDSIEVKKFMKPNTAFVTILRDPATMFESMYNFYKIDKKINASFDELLENTEKYEDILTPRKLTRYGRNQMSFDLGLSVHQFASDRDVDEFIKTIESDFELVMIAEHMEASLILLADLMGWSLDTVRFLKNNVRQPSKKTYLSELNKQKLRKLNNADTKLYYYFLEVFKSKIKVYGIDRMKEQIEELISMNQDFFQVCVDQVNTAGYAGTYSYFIKQGAPLECFYAGKSELPFTKQLRQEQIYKVKQLREIDNLMSNEESDSSFHPRR